MKVNGGFLVTKIKQLGDRIFEKILSEKNIDAFNGAQGRILYVLWQEDGISIRSLSIKCGLAITSLTTMLERMENQGLIRRVQSETDKRKTIKRTIDIIGAIIGCILLIPLTVVVYIANLITKGDNGPIFYIQKRIGQDGKMFRIYKYRTMVVGADKKLKKYLKENPEAAKEYKEYKKLKEDPRITKIGKILRKTRKKL